MSKNTRVVKARNGRYAVLARRTKHPWIQVESCIDEPTAQGYAERLEADEDDRESVVAENDGADWGDDSPATEVK